MKIEEQKLEEQKNEIHSFKKIEGFPDWIELRDDGIFKVVDRDGDVYLFEDIPNKKIIAMKRRIQGNSDKIDEDKIQLGLISEALVSPKLGELDLDEMKGSKIIRLKMAVTKIFDLDSFL